METNETNSQKTVVEHLTFGAKTAKRVTWESWEFTVVGPAQVLVTNASYGYLKDEHSYVVTVEEREEDGVVLPRECECPADRYNEEYDCKHKVALAAVGGPTVLEAAWVFSDTDPKLRADGGDDEGEVRDCDCTERYDGFPCAECYISGAKDFPAGKEEA